MAHGIIPASLQDRACSRIRLCRYLCHCHFLINVCPTLMPDTFPCIRTENEPCRIQCIPVKKRICFLHRRFQCRIIPGIRGSLNGKIHMELRPCRPSVLHLHVIPAERNGITQIRHQVIQLLRRDPFPRIFCMVIVTVHDQHIRMKEVPDTAVILPVTAAHMIMLNCLLQFFRTVHLHPVRVKAVLCIPCHIRCLQNKPHFLTPPSDLP